MNKKQMKRTYAVLGGIILLSAVLLLWLLGAKEGMHVDEYLTYGLSNYDREGYMPDPELGVRLSPDEFFDDYFYADSLNIKKVWLNQGNNVHPPLYYLLFHIFTLVTGHFLSLKTGALLNIIFHSINICLLWLILRKAARKNYTALIGTILYAFMPIILESVLFTRMYVLLSTFVLGLTLLFVSQWNSENKKAFYVKLGIISVCGALTHYYFLVYLFFCCLIWGIRLLKERKWKETAGFLLTMTASGAACLGIFPYILRQVFKSNGGKRTYSSLISLDFMENGRAFWKAINNVYGGFLLAVLLIAAVLFLCQYLFGKQKEEGQEKEQNDRSFRIIIYLPCLLFFVTVTKIAIMPGIRYISPIYGICIIALMCLFENLTVYLTKREEVQCVAGILLAGVLINSGWQRYDWPELHLEAKQYVEEAETYGANNECICILTSSWRCLPNYQEFIQYRNIIFIPFDGLELLYQEEYAGYDSVVLYIDQNMSQEETEEILQSMIAMNEGLSGYTKMHEYTYYTAYYLE